MSEDNTILQEVIDSQPGGKHQSVNRMMDDTEYERCEVALNQFEIEVEKINIFRPLRGWKALRKLRSKREQLRIERNTWLGFYGIYLDPRSCSDIIPRITSDTTERFVLRLNSLRSRWMEVSVSFDQKAASVFNIFVLYLAVVSLVISLIGIVLSVLPFLKH